MSFEYEWEIKLFVSFFEWVKGGIVRFDGYLFSNRDCFVVGFEVFFLEIFVLDEMESFLWWVNWWFVSNNFIVDFNGDVIFFNVFEYFGVDVFNFNWEIVRVGSEFFDVFGVFERVNNVVVGVVCLFGWCIVFV